MGSCRLASSSFTTTSAPHEPNPLVHSTGTAEPSPGTSNRKGHEIRGVRALPGTHRSSGGGRAAGRSSTRGALYGPLGGGRVVHVPARRAAERRGARPPRFQCRSGVCRHRHAGGNRAHVDGIASCNRAHQLCRPHRNQRLHAPPCHERLRARRARRRPAAAQPRANQRHRRLRAAHAGRHQRGAPARWRDRRSDDFTA